MVESRGARLVRIAEARGAASRPGRSGRRARVLVCCRGRSWLRAVRARFARSRGQVGDTLRIGWRGRAMRPKHARRAVLLDVGIWRFCVHMHTKRLRRRSAPPPPLPLGALRACPARCGASAGLSSCDRSPPPAIAPLHLRSLPSICDRPTPPAAIAPLHFQSLLSISVFSVPPVILSSICDCLPLPKIAPFHLSLGPWPGSRHALALVSPWRALSAAESPACLESQLTRTRMGPCHAAVPRRSAVARCHGRMGSGNIRVPCKPSNPRAGRPTAGVASHGESPASTGPGPAR